MDLAHTGQMLSSGFLLAAVVLLCLAGILLSCFSLSGTWLVVGASLLGGVMQHQWSPWCWVVSGYVLISILVEVFDGLAGAWGVKKRGGSFRGGLAALAGGTLGMIAGAWIPVPIIGPLAGMLMGTFVFVYAVEMRRLREAQPAARIARGALLARVAVIILKVVASVLMTAGIILTMIMAG